MTEHSPEPWVANECGADEFFICEESPSGKPGEDTGWGNQIGEIDGKANARRIVACVNALKGLDTQIVETAGDAIGSLVKHLLEAFVTVDAPFPQAPMRQSFLNYQKEAKPFEEPS